MPDVLAGLVGWLGYRAYQKHEDQARRDQFVQVARQGAVNLTTISYTEVDADVQRIIDLSTGAFRDDFQQRAKPFIEVVKAAQSKSEGTVTDAGERMVTDPRLDGGALIVTSVQPNPNTCTSGDVAYLMEFNFAGGAFNNPQFNYNGTGAVNSGFRLSSGSKQSLHLRCAGGSRIGSRRASHRESRLSVLMPVSDE